MLEFESLKLKANSICLLNLAKEIHNDELLDVPELRTVNLKKVPKVEGIIFIIFS